MPINIDTLFVDLQDVCDLLRYMRGFDPINDDLEECIEKLERILDELDYEEGHEIQ